MKVIQIPLNPFTMNCYIYYNDLSEKEFKEGIIIDPAVFTSSEENQLKEITDSNKIKIKFIINTHAHLDHILGNMFAKNYFKVPVLMHPADLLLLENANIQGRLYGVEFPSPPPVDEFITEDKIIKIDGAELKVLHTPGHSPGSICLIDAKNKNVFCGDLIFKNSIGRTDLPDGDFNILIDSIKSKLFKECNDNYNLYPGHMEITNISAEKKFNPFLQ